MLADRYAVECALRLDIDPLSIDDAFRAEIESLRDLPDGPSFDNTVLNQELKTSANPKYLRAQPLDVLIFRVFHPKQLVLKVWTDHADETPSERSGSLSSSRRSSEYGRIHPPGKVKTGLCHQTSNRLSMPFLTRSFNKAH